VLNQFSYYFLWKIKNTPPTFFSYKNFTWYYSQAKFIIGVVRSKEKMWMVTWRSFTPNTSWQSSSFLHPYSFLTYTYHIILHIFKYFLYFWWNRFCGIIVNNHLITCPTHNNVGKSKSKIKQQCTVVKTGEYGFSFAFPFDAYVFFTFSFLIKCIQLNIVLTVKSITWNSEKVNE